MEQGMMPNTKLAKQVILAWHQKISGDIVIMNKPNWYLFPYSDVVQFVSAALKCRNLRGQNSTSRSGS
jgi:hypothetical protein